MGWQYGKFSYVHVQLLCRIERLWVSQIRKTTNNFLEVIYGPFNKILRTVIFAQPADLGHVNCNVHCQVYFVHLFSGLFHKFT